MMELSKRKKSITVTNKTHYFDPTITRTKNTFMSPSTYCHKNQKVEGYQTRLFYEFKYCQEHQGQTFFYTLTYNDSNIPKYLGQNCFDYEDLRYLFTGGFTKYLLRNYGTKVKYFVGAELGEGKGIRGWHNNPHYHILFFLRPSQDSDYPYKKITEEEMTSLLRLYWQGEDNRDWTNRSQFYKKGIVDDGRDRYGNGLGPVVENYKAISYVSKYVTKDPLLVSMEQKIRDHFTVEFVKTILEEPESYRRFWYDYIYPIYNPGNCWDDKELFKRICGYSPYRSDYGYYVGKVLDELGLIIEYKDFCRELVNQKVEEKIKEYRNRYCNKCRISQGVGDYGLDFIEDEMEPTLPVPTKKGIKYRPINMYYYRKKYCDVVKDDQGQNIYVLNDLGIEYKVRHLKSQVNKLAERTMNNLTMCKYDVYEEILKSDLNSIGDSGIKRVYISYDEFRNFINTDIKEKLLKYAQYKLVYEGRFFFVSDDGCPTLSWLDDYRYFITPINRMVDYRTSPVSDFLQNPGEGYLAYHSHPYFLSDSWFYPVFDLLADYFFIQGDNKQENQAKENERTRRFHISRKFNTR